MSDIQRVWLVHIDTPLAGRGGHVYRTFAMDDSLEVFEPDMWNAFKHKTKRGALNAIKKAVPSNRKKHSKVISLWV